MKLLPEKYDHKIAEKKWPIEKLVISGKDKKDIEGILQDLANVSNSHSIEWLEKNKEGAIVTEGGQFSVFAVLGQESESMATCIYEAKTEIVRKELWQNLF